MWKNEVERGRPQMTLWRMRTACWIPKATNTHTHYMQFLLLFHDDNICTNAPQCYVVLTLTALFYESSGGPNAEFLLLELAVLAVNTVLSRVNKVYC
jgi:hypothetical protein